MERELPRMCPTISHCGLKYLKQRGSGISQPKIQKYRVTFVLQCFVLYGWGGHGGTKWIHDRFISWPILYMVSEQWALTNLSSLFPWVSNNMARVVREISQKAILESDMLGKERESLEMKCWIENVTAIQRDTKQGWRSAVGASFIE